MYTEKKANIVGFMIAMLIQLAVVVAILIAFPNPILSAAAIVGGFPLGWAYYHLFLNPYR